jgi:hypothetical protein
MTARVVQLTATLPWHVRERWDWRALRVLRRTSQAPTATKPFHWPSCAHQGIASAVSPLLHRPDSSMWTVWSDLWWLPPFLPGDSSIPIWVTFFNYVRVDPFRFPTLTARPRSPSGTSLRRGLAAADASPKFSAELPARPHSPVVVTSGLRRVVAAHRRPRPLPRAPRACRISQPRDAPSAPRTASSRRRASSLTILQVGDVDADAQHYHTERAGQREQRRA